jgi:hypothetical protein
VRGPLSPVTQTAALAVCGSGLHSGNQPRTSKPEDRATSYPLGTEITLKGKIVSCRQRDELHEKYLKALMAYVSHQDELKFPRVRDWAVEKNKSQDLHGAYMDTMGAWLEHVVKHGCQ